MGHCSMDDNILLLTLLNEQKNKSEAKNPGQFVGGKIGLTK